MIERLKIETRDLHEQIEEKNKAKQIMDHSIGLDAYKLLLRENFWAYSKTETEIQRFLPNFSGKKHLQLQKDLEQLGVPVEIPSKSDTFECRSYAEALGAAYVVEGSALGGMVLAKNLKKCVALQEIEKHHFFNGDKENLQDWKIFKEELEQYDFTIAEEQEAVEKAKDTFRFFYAVFEGAQKVN